MFGKVESQEDPAQKLDSVKEEEKEEEAPAQGETEKETKDTTATESVTQAATEEVAEEDEPFKPIESSPQPEEGEK